jgi:hypothetical protein
MQRIDGFLFTGCMARDYLTWLTWQRTGPITIETAGREDIREMEAGWEMVGRWLMLKDETCRNHMKPFKTSGNLLVNLHRRGPTVDLAY